MIQDLVTVSNFVLALVSHPKLSARHSGKNPIGNITTRIWTETITDCIGEGVVAVIDRSHIAPSVVF